MESSYLEWQLEEYRLTDDPGRLDFEAVCGMLRATYWAADRSKETMAEAIRHSVCLNLWRDDRQIGFCRAVTDHATFAWLADVVVDPKWRGRGLGKWMVERLLEHPAVKTRTQVLATRDAHSLYERYGFVRTEFLRRGSSWRPEQPG